MCPRGVVGEYGAQSDMVIPILYPYPEPGSRLVAGWWKNTPAVTMSEEEHGYRAGLSCSFDTHVAALLPVGWTEPCNLNHGGRCRREPFVNHGVQRPGAAAHDFLLRIALPLQIVSGLNHEQKYGDGN